MGLEPTTFCLGSRHSTIELHPLIKAIIAMGRLPVKIMKIREKSYKIEIIVIML